MRRVGVDRDEGVDAGMESDAFGGAFVCTLYQYWSEARRRGRTRTGFG